MNQALVQTSNLGKSFRVYAKSSHRFLEWVSLGKKTRHSKFCALQDITLAIYPGECIGLIGPNGAGKSTLLRILAQTLSPTTGTFSVTGRTLSLHDLGTGFIADLTGRQNVLNTAQFLGFPEGYAKSRLADIIQFADLGPFIDRPIKTYSSGMKLRIAFSMFAFFEPDVLIIDEVLAVGDASFQRKCFRRISELISDARRAVILVSHDMQSIIKLCTRVCWIDGGKVKQIGDPAIVVQEYLRETFSRDSSALRVPAAVEARSISSAVDNVSEKQSATVPVAGRLARCSAAVVYPTNGVELLGVWLEDPAGQVVSVIRVNEPFTICYGIKFGSDVEHPVFGVRLATIRGDCLIATNTQMMQTTIGPCSTTQIVVIRWPILRGLGVGEYFVSCGCSTEDELLRFLMREVDGYQFSIVGPQLQTGLCSLASVPSLATA